MQSTSTYWSERCPLKVFLDSQNVSVKCCHVQDVAGQSQFTPHHLLLTDCLKRTKAPISVLYLPHHH